MTLLEALSAHARDEIAADRVLRALIEHDRWQVPAGGDARSPSGAPSRVVIYGERSAVPPGALWLFSDEQRARRAADKGRLGACAVDVRGSQALADLDGISRLEVNPGSPADESYAVELDDRSRGLVRLWVRAIAVEQAVAAGPLEDERVLRALRDFPAYCVFLNPDRSLVTLPGRLGLQNGVAAFTAPDNAQALFDRIRDQTKPALARGFLPGRELFARVVDAGDLDGVALDAFGPGPPTALPLDLCRKLAEAGDE